MESLFSQVLVVLAIRTRRSPFWRSRPSRPLTIAVIGALTFAALLPVSPLAGPLGFVAPPLIFWPALAVMVVLDLTLVEFIKHLVFRRDRGGASPRVAAPVPDAN